MGNEEARIDVEVDLSLHSHSSILKATYKFTDHWYVEFVPSIKRDILKITFTPKSSPENRYQVRSEFLNELLDQQLREQIGSETLAVRNLIMAHALSKLDLIPDPGEDETANRG